MPTSSAVEYPAVTASLFIGSRRADDMASLSHSAESEDGDSNHNMKQ